MESTPDSLKDKRQGWEGQRPEKRGLESCLAHLDKDKYPWVYGFRVLEGIEMEMKI